MLFRPLRLLQRLDEPLSVLVHKVCLCSKIDRGSSSLCSGLRGLSSTIQLRIDSSQPAQACPWKFHNAAHTNRYSILSILTFLIQSDTNGYKAKAPSYSLSTRFNIPTDIAMKPGPGAYLPEKVSNQLFALTQFDGKKLRNYSPHNMHTFIHKRGLHITNIQSLILFLR